MGESQGGDDTMAVTNQPTIAIGELARRTGVPVKTIRFYSDQGVLPPAEVTGSGYRRYSAEDVVRLETVRTLRAAGFDIATIRDVLDRNLDSRDAMRLQIEAIAVQERTLRRQRLMLERALAGDDVAGHPDRGRALALLSAAERSAFLRHQLEAGIEDVAVDEAWWTRFIGAAVEDIPEDLDDDQLTAWIELVDMTSDPSFADAIRRTAEPFWEHLRDTGIQLEDWQARQQSLVDQARALVRAGTDPRSPEGQATIGRWAGEGGTAWQDLLRHMLDTHDPRLARYWALIAIIKRMPYDHELDAAWKWILDAAARYLDR